MLLTNQSFQKRGLLLRNHFVPTLYVPILHFTPTSSSWLNLVERWFGETTRKRIRRGVFKSVPELVAAIEEYIRLYNENPKPFV